MRKYGIQIQIKCLVAIHAAMCTRPAWKLTLFAGLNKSRSIGLSLVYISPSVVDPPSVYMQAGVKENMDI